MLDWNELYDECNRCSKCRLGASRKNVVFGEGNKNADIMFVGEAPGANEDEQGKPFVGRAGELLTKGLEALNLFREKDYFIANICKCRPENNRTPEEDEAKACLPYLRNQFSLVRPKILVCLGATSMKYIMGSNFRITRDRGKWVLRKGIYIMATFHPAALFRDESKKILFWRDLKSLKAKYDEIEKEKNSKIVNNVDKKI